MRLRKEGATVAWHGCPLERESISVEPKRIGGSNRVVSMHDAALYVGVHYKTFAKHYKLDWRIPHHVIGRMVLFRERDLEAFIERHREVA